MRAGTSPNDPARRGAAHLRTTTACTPSTSQTEGRCWYPPLSSCHFGLPTSVIWVNLQVPLVDAEWTVRDSSGMFSVLTGGGGRAPGPRVSAVGDTIPLSQLRSAHVPKTVLVGDCGCASVCGTYAYAGLVNDHPCWKLHGSDSELLAALWYFRDSLLANVWDGWYISRRPGTSSYSAQEDFYSCYVSSPLPPTVGWVSRGDSVFGGKGDDPPPVLRLDAPSSSTENEKEPDSSVSKVCVLSTMMFVFPSEIQVSGAGCEHANGVYKVVGKLNNHPYYARNPQAGPYLWYFYSPLWEVGSIPLYNGWYISEEVATSSISAKADMYRSTAGFSQLPTPWSPADAASYGAPADSIAKSPWVTLEASPLPTGGCGKNPPPQLTVPAESVSAMREVAIQLENGDVKSLLLRTSTSIGEIKLR